MTAVPVLRALRGGLPDPDAPEEQLRRYALRGRAQMEDVAAWLPVPRGAGVAEVAGAPTRALVVADARADAGAPATPGGDADDPRVMLTTAERVVVHLHGGAFCMGSPDSHRGLAAALSRHARAAVLLPTYRLTPEHRFPDALDDVVATWGWLTDELGIDPRRVVVSGDSSGGGLGVGLCVRLRDQRRALPAGIVGISPWVDLTATGDSIMDNAGSEIWIPPQLILPAARAYAGDTPLDHPLVSPLFADLTGLPPMLVHVGSEEVLLDDAVRLVAAARECGVDASLGRFDGLWHVFQVLPGFPEARDALREIGAFVRRHTTPLERARAA